MTVDVQLAERAPRRSPRRPRAALRFADALDGVAGVDTRGIEDDLALVGALRESGPRLDPTPTDRAAARARLLAALDADRRPAVPARPVVVGMQLTG